MAAKGTAGKSASGASMSKYDMEVEERLEARLQDIAELKNYQTSSGADPRVDKIIAHMAQRGRIRSFLIKQQYNEKV